MFTYASILDPRDMTNKRSKENIPHQCTLGFHDHTGPTITTTTTTSTSTTSTTTTTTTTSTYYSVETYTHT
jgi:hypothetical protein